MKTDAPTTPDHDHSTLGLEMPAKIEQINIYTYLGSGVVTKGKP